MSGGRTPRRWCIPVAVVALLLSCSGADTSAGADLFAERTLGGLRGCSTCHTVTDRASVGGPSLIGIGSQAGDRVEGLGADEYIRQSIVAPTAWFADGWGEGMPAYGDVLTADEVDDLVDYLLALR